MRSGHGKSIAPPYSRKGGNQPSHGHGEHGSLGKGLMGGFSKASSHMPLRHASGGDRKASTTQTARNGKQTGTLKASATSDTRRRKGPEGNSKGSPPTNLKSGLPASLEAHKGTAGRGGSGRLGMNDGHKGPQPKKLTESPSSAWFEKLGA